MQRMLCTYIYVSICLYTITWIDSIADTYLYIISAYTCHKSHCFIAYKKNSNLWKCLQKEAAGAAAIQLEAGIGWSCDRVWTKGDDSVTLTAFRHVDWLGEMLDIHQTVTSEEGWQVIVADLVASRFFKVLFEPRIMGRIKNFLRSVATHPIGRPHRGLLGSWKHMAKKSLWCEYSATQPCSNGKTCFLLLFFWPLFFADVAPNSPIPHYVYIIWQRHVTISNMICLEKVC